MTALEHADAASRYRRLLERLDEWFRRARERRPGVIPCAAGCSACCHGPFDVSAADVNLIRSALRRLEPGVRSLVLERSRALVAKGRAIEPDWPAPFDVDAIGDERFDAFCDALGAEPCPLLDDAGRCRIYEDRPLVCRLIGLSMAGGRGRVIENCCPIKDQFPEYAALAPEPFDLEGFEEEERRHLGEAARALFDHQAFAGFHTFIAAAILCTIDPPWSQAPSP